MPNVALIDVQKLRRNLEQIKKHLNKNCKIAAVVKGDAYGHGLLPIARALDFLPAVSMFVTASLDEALTLYKAGVEKQILILNRESGDAVLEKARYYSTGLFDKVIFSAYSAEDLSQYRALSPVFRKKLKVHLRLDFESAVKGFSKSEAEKTLKEPLEDQSLQILGLYAHIYAAYLEDEEKTVESIRGYGSFFDQIDQEIRKALTLHLYSSSLCSRYPEYSYDMVRIGVLMYGITEPRQNTGHDAPIVEGILTIKGSVLKTAEILPGTQMDYSGPLPGHVRRVALLSFGNWDLPFFFLCKDPVVSIRGKLLPIVGSPCMDSCLVDITDAGEVTAEDEALILSDQPGTRFEDWIDRSFLNFGNCQMLFSGMERITKRYVDHNCSGP